jgi:hypothetical protein
MDPFGKFGKKFLEQSVFYSQGRSLVEKLETGKMVHPPIKIAQKVIEKNHILNVRKLWSRPPIRSQSFFPGVLVRVDGSPYKKGSLRHGNHINSPMRFCFEVRTQDMPEKFFGPLEILHNGLP